MALYIGGVAVDATAAEIDVLDGLDRGSIIYGNASSATTVLGQGTADQVLTSDGTDIAWAAAAGGGDVSKVGTPANNEVGIWTGDGTIEGESDLTFDGGALVVGGTNPSITIGDAGEEDTKLVFDGNAQDYYIGLDDTDNVLKIGMGSAVGTNVGMTMESSGNATFYSDGTGTLKVFGASGSIARVIVVADAGADLEDWWQVRSNGTEWIWNSGVQDDKAAYLTHAGQFYADSTATVGTFDYAEFFEWKTALDDDEACKAAYGMTVVLDGDKVRLAEAGEESDVMGVVRPNGSALTGGESLKWQGKFLRDVWGEFQEETYTRVSWDEVHEGGDVLFRHSYPKDRIPQYQLEERGKLSILPVEYIPNEDYKLDDGGEKIPVVVPTTDSEKQDTNYCERDTNYTTGEPLMRRVYAPDYDDTKTYLMREERRTEWCIVGLLGQVPVRDTAVIPDHWKKMKNLESGIDMYYIK